jgi:hypothetical protein
MPRGSMRRQYSVGRAKAMKITASEKVKNACCIVPIEAPAAFASVGDLSWYNASSDRQLRAGGFFLVRLHEPAFRLRV